MSSWTAIAPAGPDRRRDLYAESLVAKIDAVRPSSSPVISEGDRVIAATGCIGRRAGQGPTCDAGMTPHQRHGSGEPRESDSGWCPVPRRSFLRGILGGAAAVAAANLVPTGQAHAQGTAYQDAFNKLATEDSTRSIPFYGQHQAGIATPPQTAAAFLSFDVTAGNPRELTDLFRTLTERAAFLTKGGTPPPPRPDKPPEHRHLLGPTVLPDDLTVTVAVGASLFDSRYGLAPRKPAQLKTMQAFSHDDLDPKITHGDLLVQVCANHRDSAGTAMRDVTRQTSGALRLRWRMDAFRFPPRP